MCMMQKINHGSLSRTKHIYDPMYTQDQRSGRWEWCRFQHNALDSQYKSEKYKILVFKYPPSVMTKPDM